MIFSPYGTISAMNTINFKKKLFLHTLVLHYVQYNMLRSSPHTVGFYELFVLKYHCFMLGSNATRNISTEVYNYLITIFIENITNYISNKMYLNTEKQA